MNSQDAERIDHITAAVHQLLKGRGPQPIDLAGQGNDEIRQLSEYINRLVAELQSMSQVAIGLSTGDIGIPIDSKNHLCSFS